MKKHRWVAIASYEVSERMLMANVTDPKDNPIILDHEALVYVGVGCYDCEEPFSRLLRLKACPAPAAPMEKERWNVTSLGYQEKLERPQ